MARTYHVWIDTTSVSPIEITAYCLGADWSIGASQALQDLADESECVVTVDNSTGYWTPGAGSPSYYATKGLHTINTQLVIQAEDPQSLIDNSGNYLVDDDGNRLTNASDDYTTPIYTGYVTEINAEWSPYRNIQVNPGLPPATITAKSRKHLLESVDIALPLYTNQLTNYLINQLVNAGPADIGIPLVADTGVQTIAYFGDTKENYYQLIAKLVAAERGFLHFDRQGRAVFWNRNHMTAAGSSAYTVNTSDTTNAYLPTAIGLYATWDFYANYIQVTANARFTDSSATLWSLDSAISIPVGQSKIWNVKLRKSNGEFCAAASVSVGTSTFSAGSGSVSVTGSGSEVTITATNTGGVTATLSALTITGIPISPQNKIEVVSRNTSGITAYGQHTLTFNLALISTLAGAESILAHEVARQTNTLSIPFIRSLSYSRRIGVDDGFLNTWTIGTRISIVSTELAHTSKDYYIIGEQHRLDQAMHDATFYLEPALLHPAGGGE